MNFITLKDPSVLGEKHPTYGWSVWSLTDGDYPVMFNTMDETKLLPDVRVAYEEALLKTSSKGKQYLRLKKVKFEDDPVKKEDRIPFIDKPAPTFNKSVDKAYLKDLSDYPVRLYNGNLNYAKESGLNLITDSEDRRTYLEYIMEVTDELLTYSENIRSGQGGSNENLSSSPSVKEVERPAAGQLKSAWEERKNLPKAVGWNEEDIPVNDDYPPEEP